MDNPLVSISCITYNHASYIRECLDGFLMQQCDFKFEVLIHDDASTDSTQEIIKEYQQKYPDIIKPIFQKVNQWSQGVRGMNATYNYSRAKGKYIALCEGDDYWTDPLKLQKQVDFLEENKEYVACQHARIVIDGGGRGKVESFQSHIFTQCTFFRNLFDDYFYNVNRSINILNGDSFLEYYLKANGKYHYFDFVGAVYRFEGQGVFSSINNSSKKLNSLRSYNSILKFISESDYPFKNKVCNELKEKILETFYILIFIYPDNFTFRAYIKKHWELKFVNLIAVKRIIKFLVSAK